MKNAVDYILSNLVFITRLPVKINFNYRSDAGNVKYFALVGLILGLIVWFVSLVSNYLFGSLVAATISTFTLAALTGGIHLDGLSDTADGLLSYRDKERAIEIMKDSRIGAMGVMALFAILLLKISFLNLLIPRLPFFVICMPIFGRLCIVNACYFGRPITKSKLGAVFIGNMQTDEFFSIHPVYFFVMFFISLLWGMKIKYILALWMTSLVLILFSKVFVQRVTMRIDGISGDILGAICEIGEMLSLPIFYVGVLICDKLL
ncbi:MAG: adenosylcobinamide-GDP ribazoletransferase [Peptostreptococcaceae bacterium]|nr:adenosylcobinamide-GDP ribazoletransferase [Peptostreptococcaceae bacterium]